MLGVELDPEYVNNVLKSVEGQIAACQRGKAQRKESLVGEQDWTEQDEYFAYIVGYTPSGFPVGVTWEQWEQMEENQEIESH
ncbi:MAG: hypothetical protein ACFFCW_37875 [Candidatus Hodarchaeota archaeon]